MKSFILSFYGIIIGPILLVLLGAFGADQAFGRVVIADPSISYSLVRPKKLVYSFERHQMKKRLLTHYETSEDEYMDTHLAFVNSLLHVHELEDLRKRFDLGVKLLEECKALECDHSTLFPSRNPVKEREIQVLFEYFAIIASEIMREFEFEPLEGGWSLYFLDTHEINSFGGGGSVYMSSSILKMPLNAAVFTLVHEMGHTLFAYFRESHDCHEMIGTIEEIGADIMGFYILSKARRFLVSKDHLEEMIGFLELVAPLKQTSEAEAAEVFPSRPQFISFYYEVVFEQDYTRVDDLLLKLIETIRTKSWSGV